MHRRSFIIGIGIGIVIGVLLLELFSIGEKGQQQLNAIEQKLNGEEGTPSPTPTPPATSESEAPVAPEAPTSSEESTTDTPEQLTSPKVEPVETADVASPDAADSPRAAAIYRVHPGDSITHTAKRLENNGLISNSRDFVEHFKNVDIRAGYFYVEGQMELDELKKLLTSQPLTEVEANEQISSKGLTLIQ